MSGQRSGAGVYKKVAGVFSYICIFPLARWKKCAANFHRSFYKIKNEIAPFTVLVYINKVLSPSMYVLLRQPQ